MVALSTASMAEGRALPSLPWSGLLALSTAAFTAVLTAPLPAVLLVCVALWGVASGGRRP